MFEIINKSKSLPLSILFALQHPFSHISISSLYQPHISPSFISTCPSISTTWSLISTQDERHSLDHKWHQPGCLTPAFHSDFVALLDIDGHFNSNDISLGQLSLNEGQEARDALGCRSLAYEGYVVALEASLEELWIAALGGHLRQVVRPAGLVCLKVPVV